MLRFSLRYRTSCYLSQRVQLRGFVIGHFCIAFCLNFKTSPCAKPFKFKIMSDLHENGHSAETHFHKNGFAQRLVLTLRQKVTQKWSVYVDSVGLYNRWVGPG